jgi:DNA primase
MPGRIRDDAIRDIRERASLVEVISDVVTLRKRGRSWLGLCPFHAEKTPSFTVSEERGFYHCFGCGEHGDVLAFVMRTESLPFPDAVRRVAERFGMPVPEEAGGHRPRVDPLVAVNAAAGAFFRQTLAGAAGAQARAYLAERALTEETIARFGLGYAPGGDALARHLRTQGVPVEDALTTGLLLRRDAGGLFDRFRERIIFPIVDTTGRTVAFGGRILPGRPATGDPPPKYLNSPESPLFHKGQTLYGLAAARDAIRTRKRAIVVEGYVDVIALSQAGIGEAVAPLGTALTADQLRVLRRFSDAVVACFDGDTAGRRAAARSFPVFLEAGLWGRGAFLPAGEDPDTFVRSKGTEAMEACLAASVPLLDAYLDELAGPNREAVGHHAEAAREITRVLKRVRSTHERDALARLAAQRLGVREEVLRADGVPEAPVAGPIPMEAPVAAKGPEETLVELMAVDTAIANQVRAENVIVEFEDPAWRQVAETLIGGDDDPNTRIQALPRQLRDRVVRRLLDETEDDDRQRAVADCIARIRARRNDGLRGQLREQMRAADARGDVEASQQALRRLQDLTEKART